MPRRAARLFDVEAKARRERGSTDLVALDPAVCPDCGAATVPMTVHEPALLRHGGYGATRRTITMRCVGVRCSWSMETDVTEVNPKDDA